MDNTLDSGKRVRAEHSLQTGAVNCLCDAAQGALQPPRHFGAFNLLLSMRMNREKQHAAATRRRLRAHCRYEAETGSALDVTHLASGQSKCQPLLDFRADNDFDVARVMIHAKMPLRLALPTTSPLRRMSGWTANPMDVLR